jgi:non-homologous end joining protein Ku
MLEAKVAGREIVAPPAASAKPPVINLMDALRKSIDKQKHVVKAKEIARETLRRPKARKPTGRRKSAG